MYELQSVLLLGSLEEEWRWTLDRVARLLSEASIGKCTYNAWNRGEKSMVDIKIKLVYLDL